MARRKKGSAKLGLTALLLAAACAIFYLSGGLDMQIFGQPSAVDAKPEPPKDGILQVHYIDVGQGDCQLIRIPNGDGYDSILIDTGENAYYETVSQYLASLGIERLEALICTHQHSDHMGSMARIVTNMEIACFYMPRLPDAMTPTTRAYENLLDALAEKGLKAKELCTGAEIDTPSAVQIEVLSPHQGAYSYDDINDYSGVIRLTYGSKRFLFTGDAEQVVEADLLAENAPIQADVLSCGHHGSSTSTSREFLKRVQPAYAVISCGRENQYGHPHEETLENLNASGCMIFRTDLDGTVIAETDGSDIWINKE